MSEFSNYTDFTADANVIRQVSIENGKGLLSFGIPFLDDSLRGISKTDLILLGAGSGGGKSELAFHIASHNASIGKKVLLFALEAERHEVGMRKMYKLLTKRFFADPDRDKSAYINYPDFYHGKLWKYLDKYLEDAQEEIALSASLRIRYSEHDYTLEKFAIDVESESDADLIVLDHLHYLELGDEPENKAFKKAIKKLRDTVLSYKIPIILVSQLRKENTNDRWGSVIPSLSDFHGSSDIFKVATKGIMIADGSEVVANEDLSRRPTLIRTVKSRIDGSIKQFIGCMGYDFKTNSYDMKYIVGKLQFEKDEVAKRQVEVFRKLPENPRWAVNAKI